MRIIATYPKFPFVGENRGSDDFLSRSCPRFRCLRDRALGGSAGLGPLLYTNGIYSHVAVRCGALFP